MLDPESQSLKDMILASGMITADQLAEVEEEYEEEALSYTEPVQADAVQKAAAFDEPVTVAEAPKAPEVTVEKPGTTDIIVFIKMKKYLNVKLVDMVKLLLEKAI